MTPLRVEFELTTADYERTILAVLQRDEFTRRAWRKVKGLLVLYVALITAAVAAMWMLTGELPEYLLIAGAAMTLWAAWFWPDRRRYRRIARKFVAALLRTPAGRAYLGPRTVEVGRDGLAVRSRFSTSLTRWDGVFDVIPTPDHLFLVLPGPGYLPVPRTAFEYDEDFARYCEAVADLAAAGRTPDRVD